MTDKVIFLTTTGAQVWPVPSDWNNGAFTVEIVGGGGVGSVGNAANAAGAAGGTYAKITNADLCTFTPRGTANYNVSAGSSGDTWISNTGVAPTGVTEGALAKPGQSATTGCIGSTKFGGGNGGTANASSASGGGGGAAGPGGAGGTGGNAPSGSSGGGGGGAGTANAGGAASAATGGTGGSVGGGTGPNGIGTANSGPAGVAGSGTWTSNPGAVAIGPGSGGAGGAGTSNVGGAGGAYGGGGGGLDAASGTGGAGGQGVIVITYTPILTSAAQATWRRFATLLRRGMKPRKRAVMHGSYTLLQMRRRTPYHAIPSTSWVPEGGSVAKRRSEPKFTKLRTSDPMLED